MEDVATPPATKTEASAPRDAAPEGASVFDSVNLANAEDTDSHQPSGDVKAVNGRDELKPSTDMNDSCSGVVNSLADMKFAEDIDDEIEQNQEKDTAPDDLEEPRPPISPAVLWGNPKSVKTESTKGSSQTRDEFEDEEQSYVSKQSKGGKSTKSKSSVKTPRTTSLAPPPPPPPPPKLSPYVNVTLVVAIFFGIVGTVIGIIGIIKISDDNGGTSAPDATEAMLECADGSPDCAEEGGKASSLLDVVRERGHLKCGMLFEQLGFLGQTGIDPEIGEPIYAGLDVDLCRALAAAIFDGDSEAYNIQVVTQKERWTVLNSTGIDVLFRSTRTMEREVYEPSAGTGFEFGMPYFYDGLGFGGLQEFVECAENGLVNGTCADLQICVLAATTHESVVKGLVPEDNIIVTSSLDDLYGGFPNTCNVIAGERTFISRATLRQRGYQGTYVLGSGVFSQEPLCMVTRRGDPRWTDFVDAILNSLISAEEIGFTKATSGTVPMTDLFGAGYEGVFQNAVAVRGNYGELYAHNVEAFIPRGDGLNSINRGIAPRLYVFPFGNLQTQGPDVVEASPTIKDIIERGHLRCSLSTVLGHEFNVSTQEYTGFQPDLCRAISAALFFGVDRTLFTVVDDTADSAERLRLLNEKRVDLLTFFGHTWENDVKHLGIGVGLTFTESYFYAGFAVAGIPSFVECAQNLDIVSPQCQELRVCARSSTPVFALFVEQFRDTYLVPKSNIIQMIQGLENGDCTVFSAGVIQIQRTSLGAPDYDGPYVVGNKLFAINPVGMVTKEDDPIWSAFVEWVHLSMVYAEVNGIDQASATMMPRTNVFGPLYTDIFYHAVNMAGNNAEMYERSLGQILPRTSINTINDNTKPRVFSY